MEPQVRINDPQEDKALDGWIDKIQNLVEEKDNYANDLVRTLGASLLPAGGGGRGGGGGNQQRFMRGGNWWINYGIEQKEQEEGLNISYCIMLPREVSFCNFFQLNVRKSDPRSIKDYWRWFHLKQSISCLKTFYRGFHCFTVNKYFSRKPIG